MQQRSAISGHGKQRRNTSKSETACGISSPQASHRLTKACGEFESAIAPLIKQKFAGRARQASEAPRSSLSDGPFLTAPTSSSAMEPQLTSSTLLVDRWRATSLRSTFGKQCTSSLESAPACGFGSAVRDASRKVRPSLTERLSSCCVLACL